MDSGQFLQWQVTEKIVIVSYHANGSYVFFCCVYRPGADHRSVSGLCGGGGESSGREGKEGEDGGVHFVREMGLCFLFCRGNDWQVTIL